MRTWIKMNGAQNGVKLLVPMPWTPVEPVKCLLQEPVFILRSILITQGRVDNSSLFRGENPLTEGIRTIALFETTTALDGKTDEELETIKPEDGCKAITFRPITVLLKTQNNDV